MEDDVRTFHLSATDLEVIEEALLVRRKELARRRDTLDQDDPAQRAVIELIDQDVWTGNELLARLQDLINVLPQAPSMMLRIEAVPVTV